MTITYAAKGKIVAHNYSANVDSVSNYSTVESITDSRSPLVKTPNKRWRPPTSYFRIIESGQNHTFTMNASALIDDSTGHHILKDTSTGEFAGGGYYDSIPGAPASLQQRSEQLALLSLLNTRVNLAQAFAEREQTARLAGETISRLYHAAVAVRRLDVRAAVKALKLNRHRLVKLERRLNKRKLVKPAQLWLELQYGWRPLLSDYYGTVAQLHARDSDADRYTACVRGWAKDRSITSKVCTETLPGAGYMDIVKHSSVAHKTNVRLDYVLHNPSVATLSQLGILNPVNIAWELLPFSFVADWFVPIGSYLQSLGATAGWTFMGGSRSTKTVVRSHAEFKAFRPILGPGQRLASSGHDIHANGYQMRFTRDVYDVSPIPRFPGINWKSSNYHFANGLALLALQLAGIKEGPRH